MTTLYKLLPDFYQIEDAKLGYPLRALLEPIQEKLNELHADEKALRKVQDPAQCPASFLPWIAESLGWRFMARTTENQRREAQEIANFYDLKGTPYAMRLLSRLSFGQLFQRLYEFYVPSPSSVSSICQDYGDMDHWFRYLIEGHATFALESWKQARIAERGRPYGFDRLKRHYSYCVYLRILPNEYEQGTVRPRFLHFIRNYNRWHPAGRFCYVYIVMPFFSAEDETKGDYLLEELVGTMHWDAYWRLDEGYRFDTGPGPVHESLSYQKVVEFKTLDDGRQFDEGWHWDETQAGAHAIIELA